MIDFLNQLYKTLEKLSVKMSVLVDDVILTSVAYIGPVTDLLGVYDYI